MKRKLIIAGCISAVLLGLIFVLFNIDKYPASFKKTTSKTMKFYKYDFKIDGPVPNIDFVPNEETAIKIAKAIWLTLLGEGSISDDYIYCAELKNDTIWFVSSRFRKPTLGNSPSLEIRKNDCKILKINNISFY